MQQALPEHIAIIMDGNGRWAQQRGLPRSEGHRAGARAARGVVVACRRLGIRYVTLYTFSQENWGRPRDEIKLLFQLLVDFLRNELPEMQRRGIRLHVYGDIDDLPVSARTALHTAIRATAFNTDMTLNLALNYSGRGEILRAAQRLIDDGVREATEQALRDRLFSRGQPDPDLIIRTSGELRLSNFLTFQSAYSEFFFSEALWPDFTPECLRAALDAYAGRERRFGLTQEQAPTYSSS
jgi:undecaprenyl diphosphate synthase